MKVFISSVIRGFEPFRDAVVSAVTTLRHTVIRAEDFGAAPDSPRHVCLAAVRAADAVVLLIGGRYGEADGTSGVSPTHEEFREARDRAPVLVFVQDSVEREPLQQEFLNEVRAWATGHYTASFSTPEGLRDAVIVALRDLELARSAGGVDAAELTACAEGLLGDRARRGFASPSLSLAVTGGPRQQILRPAEIETDQFARALIQEALFGPHPVFTTASKTDQRMTDAGLSLEQDEAALLVTQLGDLRVTQPTSAEEENRSLYLPALIEEDVQERLLLAVRFASTLLDRVDSAGRLATLSIVAALHGASHVGWLTRAESRRRNGVQIGMRAGDLVVARLTPPVRPRAALRVEAGGIAEDLMVVLRREVRA